MLRSQIRAPPAEGPGRAGSLRGVTTGGERPPYPRRHATRPGRAPAGCPLPRRREGRAAPAARRGVGVPRPARERRSGPDASPAGSDRAGLGGGRGRRRNRLRHRRDGVRHRPAGAGSDAVHRRAGRVPGRAGADPADARLGDLSDLGLRARRRAAGADRPALAVAGDARAGAARPAVRRLRPRADRPGPRGLAVHGRAVRLGGRRRRPRRLAGRRQRGGSARLPGRPSGPDPAGAGPPAGGHVGGEGAAGGVTGARPDRPGPARHRGAPHVADRGAGRRRAVPGARA